MPRRPTTASRPACDGDRTGRRLRQDLLSGLELRGGRAGPAEGSAHRLLRDHLRRPAADHPRRPRLRGRALRPSVRRSLPGQRLGRVRPPPLPGHLPLRWRAPARLPERRLDHASRPSTSGRSASGTRSWSAASTATTFVRTRRCTTRSRSRATWTTSAPRSVWAVFVQDEFRITRSLLLNAGPAPRLLRDLRRHHQSARGADLLARRRHHPQGSLRPGVPGAQPLRALRPGRRHQPEAEPIGSGPRRSRASSWSPSGGWRAASASTVSLYHFTAARPDQHLHRHHATACSSSATWAGCGPAASRWRPKASVGPLSARASYAFQHVRDAEADVAPVNSPAHVGRLGVSVGAAEGAGPGEQRVPRAWARGAPSTGGEVPAYGLVNLTLLARPIQSGPAVLGERLQPVRPPLRRSGGRGAGAGDGGAGRAGRRASACATSSEPPVPLLSKLPALAAAPRPGAARRRRARPSRSRHPSVLVVVSQDGPAYRDALASFRRSAGAARPVASTSAWSSSTATPPGARQVIPATAQADLVLTLGTLATRESLRRYPATPLVAGMILSRRRARGRAQRDRRLPPVPDPDRARVAGAAASVARAGSG